MVAKSGPGWRLAPSLITLVDELDRRWPHRSRISDGSIGDAAHQARQSDHNPDPSGDVRALDITEDHQHGPPLDQLLNHLVTTRDHRIKYVIYEARIVRSYPTATVPAWRSAPYTGPNQHRHHMHVSVLDTPVARDSRAPWYPPAGGPALKIPDRRYPGIAREGHTGAHVKVWQQALNERGAHLRVDGIFGPKTRATVEDWQRAHGLVVDGIAGPATWHTVLFA